MSSSSPALLRHTRRPPLLPIMGKEETGFTSLSFQTACEHADTLPPRRRWQLYPRTDDECQSLLKRLPSEALEDPKVARYLGLREKEREEQHEGGKVLDKAKEELGYPLRAEEAEGTANTSSCTAHSPEPLRTSAAAGAAATIPATPRHHWTPRPTHHPPPPRLQPPPQRRRARAARRRHHRSTIWL